MSLAWRVRPVPRWPSWRCRREDGRRRRPPAGPALTTFTVLRRARIVFAKRRRARDGVPLDAWERPEDDQVVIVITSWT